MRRLVISDLAQEDLISCFSWTLEHFGLSALDRYENLLFHAFQKLQFEPTPAGSRLFERNVYLFHIRFCRKDIEEPEMIVIQPRHFIAYRFNETHIEVLRILHDSMDLSSHI